MKIYIGFSAPKGNFKIFASLIKWVEARPYDHTYIRLPEPMDNEYVIFQASKQMVNIFNKDIFSTSNTVFKEYEIEVTDEQYIVLWQFVRANLGIPYSLKEDFGILLMKVFHLKNQPFNEGMSAQFCSKLAAIVCKMLGIEVPADASEIDPSMMDKILEGAGFPCVETPKF